MKYDLYILYSLTMNDEKMTLHLNDISIADNDGNMLTGKDAFEYLNKNRENNIVVNEKLAIGDIVKLKYLKEYIKVSTIDGTTYLYSGVTQDDKDSTVLFDQEDIEKIIK